MIWTSTDRWTCPNPTCRNRTVTVHGSADDTAAAIRAVQERHGTEHRKAAVLSARLRKTDVRRPAPRYGAA